MKGVSEVIAIILILMITATMAGLAFMFFSETTSSVSSTTSSVADSAAQALSTSMTVNGVAGNTVYVRNSGKSDLTDFAIFVNDVPATFTNDNPTLRPGETATIKIYDYLVEGDRITISTPGGYQYAYADPCKSALLCLKFDEGSGTVAYDSSPKGNNFKITGMPNISWTSGASNSGVLISSNLSTSCLNQGAAVVNNATLSADITSLPSAEFSVEMMIKYASSRSGTFFHLSTNQSGSGYNGLWAVTGTFRIPNNSAVTNEISFTNTLSLGTWHHIVYVFDNVRTHTQYVYADGVKVASGNLYGSFGRVTGINVGTYVASCEDASSGNSIDDFRVYNKALY